MSHSLIYYLSDTPLLLILLLFLLPSLQLLAKFPTSKTMRSTLLLFFLLLLLLLFLHNTQATPSFPLSTSGRWIVDGAGHRAKLACANWASHMEAVAAEGLGKQPVDGISKRVRSMGFNCVRLTWPTELVTDGNLNNRTVRQSLYGLGLMESAAGVKVNNPQLLDLTLIRAFQAVVSNLGSNGIMVILDNQITKPGWCCSKYDDNGFFGDRFFDPDEWLQGLTQMATLFKTSTNVVGMSLRNELRGPNQTVSAWYRYMKRGAEAVHAANPNVLVILSGLDYDKDLSFLSENQVQLSFKGKLVFELHWYGFSDGGDWQNGNINEVCASAARNFTRKGGFLLDQGWPLFLSEFGLDIRGTSVADNRFMSCFASVAADLDLDWAIWALQGSYYVREGQLSFDETYGVLSWDWCKPRNANFLRRISALQSSFQGPGLSNIAPYDVIFHPQSGLCVLKNYSVGLPELGSCAESEAWNYTSDYNILLKDAELCLQAEGLGKQAKLGDGCGKSNSKWELLSDSKMQLSLLLPNNGSRVCLDICDNGTLVTNLCECQNQVGVCDPGRQWFKIIKSTRDVVGENFNLRLFSDGSGLE